MLSKPVLKDVLFCGLCESLHACTCIVTALLEKSMRNVINVNRYTFISIIFFVIRLKYVFWYMIHTSSNGVWFVLGVLKECEGNLINVKVYFHFCFPHTSDRILALEKLGAVFNQVAFPLQYTPRRFVIHPETNNLVLIETDHNAYTEATKAQRKQQMAEVRTQGNWGYHGFDIQLFLVLIHSLNDAFTFGVHQSLQLQSLAKSKCSVLHVVWYV